MFNPFSTVMSIWNGHPRIQVTGSNATAKAVTPASRTVNILNRRVPATHPAYVSISLHAFPRGIVTTACHSARRTSRASPPPVYPWPQQRSHCQMHSEPQALSHRRPGPPCPRSKA
ncbi:hypothetical protein OF83DRAFT_145185 [Amylostereum chailletii]|nr:hypothetical protein OF83DRAFT_145185 [Amylostereum chailletii]